MKTISDDIFNLGLKEFSKDLKLKKDLKKSTWKPKTKNVHIIQNSKIKLKKLSRLTKKAPFQKIYN